MGKMKTFWSKREVLHMNIGDHDVVKKMFWQFILDFVCIPVVHTGSFLQKGQDFIHNYTIGVSTYFQPKLTYRAHLVS